jgi:hypothetical protein
MTLSPWSRALQELEFSTAAVIYRTRTVIFMPAW